MIWRDVSSAYTLIAYGLLLHGATAKLGSTASLTGTITQIGLPRHARRLALAVVVTEFSALLSAVAGLRLLSAALVCVLACAFAFAGYRGLRAAGSISCTCFGPASTHALGWTQILSSPLWLGAAAAVNTMPSTTMAQRLQVAAIVSGCVVVASSASVARMAWRARTDRRALMGGV